jgi:hypothetical protein
VLIGLYHCGDYKQNCLAAMLAMSSVSVDNKISSYGKNIMFVNFSSIESLVFYLLVKGKGKGVPRQAEVAQRVPVG